MRVAVAHEIRARGVRATLHDWVPTFALSSEGIVFALAFGVAVWLLFQSLWYLIALLSPRRSHDARAAYADLVSGGRAH